jgi:hypothetical protein
MSRIIALALPCFLAFFILFGASTGFTSCTKTNTKTITDTVDITKTDTVNADTAVTTQILTSHTWMLQYYRSVTGDSIVYYTRGGAYNEDFDAETLAFSSNLTGTFVDGSDASHSFTWSWSNSSNTQLSFVVANPSPLPSQTIVWDNLAYRNDSLIVDQYWSYETTNSQAEAVFVPQN